MRFVFPVVIIATFLLLSNALNGQNDDEKIEIGLTLSGGSAHGLAHIGVIQYLEEMGLEVKYVTGTSMGAIVGGMYAMGYDSDQILRIAAAQDWDDLLSSHISMNHVAPIEWETHDKFPLEFDVDNSGIHLPRGFINSQKLDLLISKIYAGAFDIEHFDQLPRPFRCMAVDIENGDIVEFEDGYLGDAIRASMSIPSVFTPVENRGRLLVDGGLRRNFPVEEVKRLGADYVIGVFVGTSLQSQQDLNSLIDVLSQSAFMMGALDSKEQLNLVDVFIEPEVKDFPSFGFEEYQLLVKKGYEAAKAKRNELLMLKNLLKNEKQETIRPLKEVSSFALKRITFPNNPQVYEKHARGKFGNYGRGQVSIDRVEEGINKIFGTHNFNDIKYQFSKSDSRLRSLEVIANPRRDVKLQAALNYINTSKTAVILGVESHNMLGDLTSINGLLRLSENFGASLKINKRDGWDLNNFYGGELKYHQYEQGLFDLEQLRQAFSEEETRIGMHAGRELNSNSLLKGEFGIRRFNTRPIGGLSIRVRRYREDIFYSQVQYRYNTLDDFDFPSSGIHLSTQVGFSKIFNQSINGLANNDLQTPDNDNYFFFRGKFKAAIPISEELVVDLTVPLGWKSQETFFDNYKLGGLEERGFHSFSALGLRTNQLHFYRFGGLTADLRYQMTDRVYTVFSLASFAGKRTFHLVDSSDRGDEINLITYGIGVAADTPLGPIKLAIGRNTLTDETQVSFLFGYEFF